MRLIGRRGTAIGTATLAALAILLAGCLNLLPARDVDLEVHNVRPVSISVVVRVGSSADGPSLANLRVGPTDRVNERWGEAKFLRTGTWTIWVDDKAVYSSDAFSLQAMPILILTVLPSGQTQVEQQSASPVIFLMTHQPYFRDPGEPAR